MRIAVDYQDERLEFEIDDDRVVGHRGGSPASEVADPRELARESLASPRSYPPFARAVVPGDRVVVPLDPALPDAAPILEAVVATLRTAEVESIDVVCPGPAPAGVLDGVTWHVHDPDDRAQIAYLASTGDGRRVYLNRLLTDADLVVPIGTLGYDATLGYRGPWSVIYPGLSDRETQARYRAQAVEEPPDRERPRSGLEESTEVSWLLGCQFQVGVLPGDRGTGRVLAGLESAVRAEGAEAIDATWTFRVEGRSDLVVAGIGAPGRPTTIDDLAAGLATAARLVRRGGKVVALTTARGEVGPAVRRLAGAENPRAALNRLRGHEADPDYPAARQLAAALAWADIYLYSGLDPEVVDDLSLIPLDRPEEARKLAATAASCTLLSQADRTRALVDGEA